MKLIYPNKTEVENKKRFIYSVGGKNYLFYVTGDAVNGMETVCFGELKDNSLFAVAAEDLEKFKVFLTDLANNKLGPDYVLVPETEGEVTIYGGSKTQLSSAIVDGIVVPATTVVEPAPVVEPTPAVVEPTPAPVQESTVNVVEPTPAVVEPTPAVETPVTPEPVQTETPVTPTSAVEPVKKPKKGMSPIVIIAIIMVLVAGGYYGYKYYSENIANKNNESTSTSTTTTVTETPIVNANLSCIINTEETTYSNQKVMDIIFNGTAGSARSITETNMYTFKNQSDYETFVAKDKAVDRSADEALGISYTTYPDATAFTYKTFKVLTVSSVSEATWSEYSVNYGTPAAAQVYLTAQGYSCTISD